MKTPQDIRQDLMALADEDYRLFQGKLMPTVSLDKVLGVRMPQLRSYAKGLKPSEIHAFLNDLPHRYYDEDNLHGILLAEKKDFATLLPSLEKFLPYIDNWATCDMLRPKIFAKHTEILLPYIQKWLASDHLYTVRFAIGLLLSFYLEDAFEPLHLSTVGALASDEYYIQMMMAWYFATALAVRWSDTLPYLTEHRLAPTVHKMTVRKAIESYRISSEQKAVLKAIR